jgi:hypothetical protein
MKKPVMNGASDQLQRLREQAEAVSRELIEAAQDLAFTHRGLAEVAAAHVGVIRLIEEVRGVQMLSNPQNWRILAAQDEAFTYEFLRNVDDAVFRAAFKALSPEIRQRLREDMEDGE